VVMYRDGEQREFARKMRNEPTEPEHRLWLALRANQLGVKFRRQAAIGSYDARRTSWLESRGFRTLRFWNHELDDGLTLVIAAIQAAVEEATPTTAPSPHPSPPRRGVGAGGISTGPERGP
jgi:very-short-patch-repair endonuclease